MGRNRHTGLVVLGAVWLAFAALAGPLLYARAVEDPAFLRRVLVPLAVVAAATLAAARLGARPPAGADESEVRQRIADELRAAESAKSDFLARMSHELRTPIHSVLGMVDLLLAEDRETAGRERLEVIRTSGETLLALVDDILDHAKIEAGKIALRPEDFRLRDVVGQSVRLLERQAEEKGLEMRLEVTPELPEALHGDPLRLRQVLVNLIGNAVKFTPEGSVTVEVSKVSGGRNTVRFAVRDTGIGISDSNLENLFAAFAQADSTAARAFGGTGLGLAISRHLIELMGGEIGCESVHGVGSTFFFELPLVEATSFSEPEAEPPAGRPARGARVLVVDNEATNCLVACSHLADLGCEADSAASGPEALRRLAEQAYDVVLMDCQMPEVDGYETTRRLRREHGPAADGGPVVIAVTAHVLPGERERCLAAGMDDYLAKPFRRTHLSGVLGRWTSTAEVLDREVLASIARLSRRTGTDQLGKLAADFRRDSGAAVGEIRQGLQEGDAPRVRAAAHGLAGAAGMLGARDLEALGRELEAAADREELTAAAAVLEGQISKERERVLTALGRRA